MRAASCKLVSLDTSSSETGYAIFLNAEYHDSGVLQSDKKLKNQPKMDDMCRRIIRLLKAEKPDIVAIERMSVGRNVRTARILSEIIGVVYGWCLANEETYYEEMTPTQWRSHLGFQSKLSREELKTASIECANRRLGLHVVSDNEADAICIGLAYIEKWKGVIT